jgi:transposase InsO family protein
MQEDKFVDPRLQAREALFQQLHLSTFETMANARAVQQQVEESGYDVETSNAEFQQLLRDYEITKNLSTLSESHLEALCEQTNGLIKSRRHANATLAQLSAAATSALNHWRILSEIPLDLREKDEVTKALKEKFQHHKATWEYILADLT